MHISYICKSTKKSCAGSQSEMPGSSRKGMLYLRLAQKDLAMECFILSVQVAQYNWSCWLSIAQCIGSTSQVGQGLPAFVFGDTDR